MSADWGTAAARARGLTAHLLPDERLRRVERSASVGEVARELGDTVYGPFLPQPHEPRPEVVERAVTRSLTDRLAIVARWTDGGAPLQAVFLEQDVLNLRAILRGLVGALPPSARLAGAIPTPSLDGRALELLAGSKSAGAVAATLVAWSHPLGPALLDEASRTHVDLFRLEAAMDRAFARATTESAGRAGRDLRRFMVESLDARNVLCALVLSSARSESPPGELFVEGGACLPRDAFERAASAGSPARAAEVLGRATRGTLFAVALDGSPSPGAAASRILAGRIERLRREARARPVSPLPVLLFILRLRVESIRLRRGLWSAAVAEGGEP